MTVPVIDPRPSLAAAAAGCPMCPVCGKVVAEVVQRMTGPHAQRLQATGTAKGFCRHLTAERIIRAAAEGDADYRPELPPAPPAMAALPLDGRGYPVPFFAGWHDGLPDHRLQDAEKWARATTHGNCWLCGQLTGVKVTFTIGPMCAVNRISSEPPSHYECAEYAVRACPFLSRPRAHRREAGMPEELRDPAGTMITRNPGVILLWETRSWSIIRDPAGRPVISVGDPVRIEAYTEGRRATPAELEASITSGLPALEAACRQEHGVRHQRQALAALARQTDRARRVLQDFAA